MTRMFVLATLISVAIAGAFAFYRRRTASALEYEVHPPLPDSMRAEGEADQQMPTYYGGERLGQREGVEHFAAQSQG